MPFFRPEQAGAHLISTVTRPLALVVVSLQLYRRTPMQNMPTKIGLHFLIDGYSEPILILIEHDKIILNLKDAIVPLSQRVHQLKDVVSGNSLTLWKARDLQ